MACTQTGEPDRSVYNGQQVCVKQQKPVTIAPTMPVIRAGFADMIVSFGAANSTKVHAVAATGSSDFIAAEAER